MSSSDEPGTSGGCDRPEAGSVGQPYYLTNGTTSLFAALSTDDATVNSSLHRRHRTIEFKRFLAKIDSIVPEQLDLHLVGDHYATLKSPAIRRCLEIHPRFHMVAIARSDSRRSFATDTLVR